MPDKIKYTPFTRIEHPEKKVYKIPELEFSTEDSETAQMLEEAYQWQKLFHEGWITAHELENLEALVEPDFEGELFKVETEKLRAIRAILDENLSDIEFKNRLPELRSLLPAPFRQMIGVQQTSPHGDFDPTDHTLNTLHELDTTALDDEERHIARLVLCFHDVGKVIDAQSREHPRWSETIAADYLEKMGYTPEVSRHALKHIKWHELLGDIARQDGYNIFDARDALEIFDTDEDLELHYRIVRADVASIPGLERYIPNIDDTYNGIINYTKIFGRLPETSDQKESLLPFEPVDKGDYLTLQSQLDRNVPFDDIDIKQEMKLRNNSFNECAPEDRELIEHALVQFTLNYHPLTLHALKLTGRETDAAFADELEKKYDMPLDHLRMAIQLFRLTYGLWHGNNLIKKTDRISTEEIGDLHDRSEGKLFPQIRETLRVTLSAARELAQYAASASHNTMSEYAQKISATGEVKGSSPYGHFEGRGIYMGLFRTFRDWISPLNQEWQENADETSQLNFNIRLADGLPIIINYNFPKALFNMLAHSALVTDEEKSRAIPKGTMEWHQEDYGHIPLERWKAQIMTDLLRSPAFIVADEEGKQCLIIDTNEPPIVWASLARALRIRRCIPLAQIEKMSLPTIDNPDLVALIRQKRIDAKKDGVSHYAELAARARRIRGITAREIVEEYSS